MVAGARMCFVHTFCYRILPVYISGKISRGNDWAGRQTWQSPHQTPPSLPDFKGTTSDSWGDLEPVRQLFKNNSQLNKPWVRRKTPHDLALLWWVGDSFAQSVFELGGQFEIAETHKSPMTPKCFLIFALFFFVFPTGNRFGWQLDFSGCLFIYVIMTLEGIPNFQIRTNPWLSCISLL